MISLIGPIGIFIGKVVLKNILVDEIDRKVEEGINAVEDEKIEKPLRQHWKECYTIFIINISLLAIATVVVPWFATKEITQYIVFSVYFSIIIHSILKWIQRGWKILEFVAHYKFNLKKKIQLDVKKYIENSTFWERIFLPSEENLVHRFYLTTLERVFVYGSKIVLATVFYIIVFRLMVIPLIESTTGLNYIESAIYPFVASSDYFLGSDLLTLSIGSFSRS